MQRALRTLTLAELMALTLAELQTMVIDPSEIDARTFRIDGQDARPGLRQAARYRASQQTTRRAIRQGSRAEPVQGGINGLSV